MSILKKIGDAITTVNEKINNAASWLIYPLVIVIMFEVVRRYIFNSPTNWVYDMTWILYGIFVFLGGAHGLHTGVHVKADIIYNMMPKKGQAIFDLISYVIFFFPVMGILVYSTFTYFLKSFAVKDVSIYTTWAPLLWPFNLILCISMVMLLFQGFVEFAHAVSPLFHKKEKSEAKEVVEQ